MNMEHNPGEFDLVRDLRSDLEDDIEDAICEHEVTNADCSNLDTVDLEKELKATVDRLFTCLSGDLNTIAESFDRWELVQFDIKSPEFKTFHDEVKSIIAWSRRSRDNE